MVCHTLANQNSPQQTDNRARMWWLDHEHWLWLLLLLKGSRLVRSNSDRLKIQIQMGTFLMGYERTQTLNHNQWSRLWCGMVPRQMFIFPISPYVCVCVKSSVFLSTAARSQGPVLQPGMPNVTVLTTAGGQTATARLPRLPWCLQGSLQKRHLKQFWLFWQRPCRAWFYFTPGVIAQCAVSLQQQWIITN